MPIYGFRCKNPESPYHEKDFEVLWKMSEYDEWRKGEREFTCPITGDRMIRSWKSKKGPELKFLGTGFYVTDYRNK